MLALSKRTYFIWLPVAALSLAAVVFVAWRMTSSYGILGRWGINRYLHVIRVRADVSVGGHKVKFDEYVECRPSGNIFKVAKGKRLPRVSTRRPFIARKLPDGSAVILRVNPRLCWQWQHIWFREHRLARENRPPANFLPRLYWVDNFEAPTRIDVIVSEAYYLNKDARIQLKNFSVNLASFPPPSAIVDRARRQAGEDPPTKQVFNIRCHRLAGVHCWWARFLQPASKKELLARQTTAKYLESLGSKTRFVLPPASVKAAIGTIVRFRHLDWDVVRYGIPRSGDNHGLLDIWSIEKLKAHRNRLWLNRIRARADTLIPVICNEDTCAANPKNRGYLVFHRRMRRSALFWYKSITYKGFGFPYYEIFTRGYLYDSETMSMYRISSAAL